MKNVTENDLSLNIPAHPESAESKKICLTCTNKNRILSDILREIANVDATAKRLIETLRTLERESESLNRKIESVRTSLRLAGVKPAYDWSGDEEAEREYASRQPFSHLSLADTCRQIFVDFGGNRLTKSDVEYLATRGGYQFTSKDPSNSVDVTLRRLASEGWCEVERARGPKGNIYFRAVSTEHAKEPEEKGKTDAASTKHRA